MTIVKNINLVCSDPGIKLDMSCNDAKCKEALIHLNYIIF